MRNQENVWSGNLVHAHNRNKFTLIELLVVISIIAILAGMLLPALGGAKKRAKAIQCIGNHKQLATTTLMYADDYNGYMPPPQHMTYSWGAGDAKWSMFIWSYATKKKIDRNYPLDTVSGLKIPSIEMLRCPGVQQPLFDVTKEMKHIGRNFFFEGTYSVNLSISRCRWPSVRMLYSDYYYHSGNSVNVTHYTSGGPYSGGYVTYLHPGNTATITHLDGHVASWSLTDIPKTSWDSRFWGAGSDGISKGTLP